jgi:FkbM family methyltransferase
MNRQHILPQVLLRSWPFPYGSGRIIDHYFSRLAFDGEVAAVRTTDGFTINVLPNDLIGRHIYLTGKFDRSNVEVLLKYSEPGDVLLDIGANIGYVSACFLQNIARSKVIAIEPQPKIVELLQSNLKPFGSERYKVFPVGLSDRDATGWLEICDSNRGASKIVDERNSRSVMIELWSIERLFASLQGEKIDLIKIDVEGHEATVLRACETHLGRVRPRAILFEDHTRAAAPDGSIGQIFGRLGYRVFGVKKHLTRLEFVPIATARDCTYNDYLAAPS